MRVIPIERAMIPNIMTLGHAWALVFLLKRATQPGTGNTEKFKELRISFTVSSDMRTVFQEERFSNAEILTRILKHECLR